MSQYTTQIAKAPKGHTIPPLLRDVGAFVGTQDHGTLGWFDVFGFDAIPSEYSPENAKRLQAAGFSFLKLPDGSLLALLKNAVVLLGSEGETRTVADSLEAFLVAWSEGSTGIYDLDDDDASSGREALAAWIQARGLRVPKAPRFDFSAWLDGEAPTPEVAPVAGLGTPTDDVKAMGPALRRLVSLLGQRADSPEVVRYAEEVLGKPAPRSTTPQTDSINLEAPKAGVELNFTHEVLHEAFPPIPKTARTFVPYLSLAWVRPQFPEPVLGLDATDLTEEAITKKLGPPTELRPSSMLTDALTVPHWVRPLDSTGTTELVVSLRKVRTITLQVHEARALDPFSSVGTALFVGWAATRGLLEPSRFAAHAEQLAAVRRREARGSELMKAALPRGLWDAHLRDLPGLRLRAYRWFHNMNGLWIDADLLKVFGKDAGGAPKLEADTWAAVDAASPVFEKHFAQWLD
ncbi:hypothetical protein [Corallococcus sp. Z5C101001]|uniref:hypothetical protein n=1 Tax=Corallococcus sp. Z5C101001 TaxID=2596829 RepID=UPI00117E932D|nr:hypothetical protein [Corallococcus sp. Z5C101001]TSC33886.1 hypothetical protein FOF48_02230 [Corallococcus sp. Z5C101001]